MPPALTCQARPQQEGEARATSMHRYTRFPVFILSPNPSYDAYYTRDYLSSSPSQQPSEEEPAGRATRRLGICCRPMIRGYCVLLLRYLQDVRVPDEPQERSADHAVVKDRAVGTAAPARGMDVRPWSFGTDP
jgi:hypothetical protein